MSMFNEIIRINIHAWAPWLRYNVYFVTEKKRRDQTRRRGEVIKEINNESNLGLVWLFPNVYFQMLSNGRGTEINNKSNLGLVWLFSTALHHFKLILVEIECVLVGRSKGKSQKRDQQRIQSWWSGGLQAGGHSFLKMSLIRFIMIFLCDMI